MIRAGVTCTSDVAQWYKPYLHVCHFQHIITEDTPSMGCAHSMDPPTEATFTVPHHMKDLLTRDLRLASGHSFLVSQNAWKKDPWQKETPKPAVVDSLHGIQFVWESDDRCAVKKADGTLIVVMVASGQQSNCRVQILGFEPASSDDDTKKDSTTTPVTKQQQRGRRPQYERAKVQKHLQKGITTFQYDLRTATDGTFVTEYFGEVLSRSGRKFVLTTTPTRPGSKAAGGDGRKVVASLEEGKRLPTKQDYREPWQCRTCPGVDAVLVACFVVALDKLKDMYNDDLRRAKMFNTQ